jgi:transposase
MVERGCIIWLSKEGKLVAAIAEELRVSKPTVRLWIKRFNANGLEGLADQPRTGRPWTYTPEEVGELIASALTNPKSLGLPFASWTLDRLEAYLNEQKGIAMKRSRIDEILIAEGLRWRAQETWFSQRAVLERSQQSAANQPDDDDGAVTAAADRGTEGGVDPDFAQKRGRSSSCIPIRRQVALS